MKFYILKMIFIISMNYNSDSPIDSNINWNVSDDTISFSSDDTVKERIEKYKRLGDLTDEILNRLSEEDLLKLLRLNNMGWKINQWNECHARYSEKELMKIGLKSKKEHDKDFVKFMDLIRGNKNLFSGYYQNEEQMLSDFNDDLIRIIKLHKNQSEGDGCLDNNYNLKKQTRSWKGSDIYLKQNFQTIYNRLKECKHQDDETKDLIRLLEELIKHNNLLEAFIKSCKDYDPKKDYSQLF
jgi:hypothetical protein